MKTIFLGSGNLATRLSLEMHRKGMRIGQVYSHTPENAQRLAARLGCPWTTDPEAVGTDADLYVFSLKDAVLADVIARIRPNNGLWVHTAGSMPMDVFSGYASDYGVLYPMQTFSKTREVDFSVIPFFLEANTPKMPASCNKWRRCFRGMSVSCRPPNAKVCTWRLSLPAILPTIFMRWLLNYCRNRIYRPMSCCRLSTRRRPRYMRCRRGWRRPARPSGTMRM